MEAAREGRTDVVEELIRRGTDVNVQNEVRCLRGYCRLRERNGGREGGRMRGRGEEGQERGRRDWRKGGRDEKEGGKERRRGGRETERRNRGECVRREGGERGGDIWGSEVEVGRWKCKHVIIIIITRCFIFWISLKFNINDAIIILQRQTNNI